MSLRKKQQDHPRCWDRAEGTLALRVELPTGEIHTFPYTRHSHSHLSRTNTEQTLLLKFDPHTIKITGKILKDLILAIQKQSLDWIKPSEPTEQKSSKEVFILSIEIMEETQEI
ncbi:MAG: hypothetical protein ACSHXL_02810 [Bacteroidota bacterium]